MKISIITLFPKMIEGFFAESIAARARQKGLIDIQIINLRDFAVDDYGSVDDRPYGGGAGMVLRVEPIYKAISNIKNQISKIQIKNQKLKTILTSPRGRVFNQHKAKEYSLLDHLIIVAGHYEGVDERVVRLVDEEVSLGDFILTGGEIAAAALVDSVVRLIPAVLKRPEAVAWESFLEVSLDSLVEVVGNHPSLRNLRQKGIVHTRLLEHPQYTRPEEFQNFKVPKILLSGDHKKITIWRLKAAFEETLKKRPDLLVSEALL